MVHHIWIRGVEGQTIFLDDEDREDFIRRLSIILPDAGTKGLAWALLTNHAHLLLRTGRTSVSHVMRRVNTGYARRFNDRHDRVGYLFQSRFGSRSATDASDLRRLIRYVHLNPVGAGLVRRADLSAYRWSGHSAHLAGRPAFAFEDVDGVLELFGASHRDARRALRRFVIAGEPGGDPPSAPAADSASKLEIEAVPLDPDAALETAVSWAADHTGVGVEVIDGGFGSQTRIAVKARGLAVATAVDLGVPAERIRDRLRMSAATVSRMRSRGSRTLAGLGTAGEEEMRRLRRNLQT